MDCGMRLCLYQLARAVSLMFWVVMIRIGVRVVVLILLLMRLRIVVLFGLLRSSMVLARVMLSSNARCLVWC